MVDGMSGTNGKANGGSAPPHLDRSVRRVLDDLGVGDFTYYDLAADQAALESRNNWPLVDSVARSLEGDEGQAGAYQSARRRSRIQSPNAGLVDPAPTESSPAERPPFLDWAMISTAAVPQRENHAAEARSNPPPNGAPKGRPDDRAPDAPADGEYHRSGDRFRAAAAGGDEPTNPGVDAPRPEAEVAGVPETPPRSHEDAPPRRHGSRPQRSHE